MAARGQKDVELVIKAKDLSAKTLKETEATIKEVTSALEAQAQAAQDASGDINKLKDVVTNLGKQESTLASQSSKIDKALASTTAQVERAAAAQARQEQSLHETEGALAAARAAYDAAAETLSEYMAAVGGTAKATKEQKEQIAKLSEAVKTQETAIDKAKSALGGFALGAAEARNKTEALRKEQATLAGAQASMAAATASATAATKAQKEALDAATEASRKAKEAAREREKAEKAAATEAAKANDRAREALDRMTGKQRESLSWYQRVRGEVLALSLQFVGLQAAINLAKGALEAVRNQQRGETLASLIVGSDDTGAIGEEMEYIAGVADRLGFRIKDLRKQYGEFAISAKAAGASQQEFRFIFEKVAEAVRVLNLSAADADGVFRALGQMLGKNAVQAEELRGQLGDRLPAAVTLFAQSMGKVPSELAKLMEEGKVGAENILGFAKKIEEEYGRRIPKAIVGLDAEMNRFLNSWDKFLLKVGKGGFADGFTNFLRDMSKFLNSDDAGKFADQLGRGMTAVLDIFKFLIDNLESVSALIKIIVALKLASFFTNAASAAAIAVTRMIAVEGALLATNTAALTAASGMDAATASTKRLAGALTLLQRALQIVAAAVIGWEIGKWLDSNFSVARKASALLAKDIEETWIKIKAGVTLIGLDITASLAESFNSALTAFDKMKAGFLGGLADLARKLGLDRVAASIAESVQTGILDAEGKATARAAQISAIKRVADGIRAEREKALAENEKKYEEMLNGVGGVRAKLTAPRANNGTAAPDKSSIKGPEEEDKKAAEKRARLAESLADKLNAIEASVAKKNVESLADRVEATKRAYKDIEDAIDAAAKAGVKEIKIGDQKLSLQLVRQRVEELKKEAVTQETLAFNKDELARREKAVNDLVKERAERVKEIIDMQANGDLTPAESMERIKTVNAEMGEAITKAAKGAVDFANGLKGTPGLSDNKLDALIAKMERINTQFSQQGKGSQNAADAQTAFQTTLNGTNDILAQRNAVVANYNKLVELGALTQVEANEKIKQAYLDTQPQIDRAVEAMRAFLNTLSEADIGADKLAALRAQLDLLQASANYADQDVTSMKNAFTGAFQSEAVTVVNQIGTSLVEMARGTKSVGEGFRDMGRTALSAVGTIIQAVADAITRILAMRAAMAIIGMISGPANAVTVGGPMDMSNPIGIPIKHAGGVVGGAGWGNRTRSVNPAIFANAPRYHGGTIVGLGADERAAILQDGEEVLSKDNPRNIMNRGMDAVKARGEMSVRNVLVMDPNFMSDALQSSQGEKTMISWIGKNRGTVRKALGF